MKTTKKRERKELKNGWTVAEKERLGATHEKLTYLSRRFV